MQWFLIVHYRHQNHYPQLHIYCNPVKEKKNDLNMIKYIA